MAEMVDARDLKSLGVLHRAGSTPAPGTNTLNIAFLLGGLSQGMGPAIA